MELREIITALEAEDPAKVLPLGFTNPHSSRAYYEQLAFEPAANVTVGAMLADARGAISETYCGYKGGEYTMTEYTDCHLAEYGTCGEEIGPTLLRLMLAAGKVPAPAAEPTDAQRCPSCDHLTEGHQEDGCWYTVSVGLPELSSNLVCVCTLPHGKPADTPERDAEQAGGDQ